MAEREIDLTRKHPRNPSKQPRIERLWKRLNEIEPASGTEHRFKTIIAALLDLLEAEL